MKISIHNVETSIAATIEAIAYESDSIASGIIGSSFACSGPGSGWQQNFDVTDYAERALAADYGASSYIDSSDGREATLEDGDIVWTDDSVVEIELPTVEEALENPDAWAILRREASSYGVDENEIEALTEKITSASEIIAEITGAKATAGEDAYLWLHSSGDCILWPSEEDSEGDDGSTALARWQLTKEQAEALSNTTLVDDHA